MEMNIDQERTFSEPAALLKALGHPARLQILHLLRGGEVCVCHIERVVGRRQAYVSQQLMVLRDAGIVSSRRDGLQVYYRLADARVEMVLEAAGAPLSAPPAVLANCPCPSCAIIPVAAVC